ncbi:MAG: hypothetical protein KDB14_27680 [Planctomycetales bacterium]|nr:hypothetical protein [Planctomycetales bacterium]
MRANIAAKLSPDWLPELNEEQVVELAELLRLLGEPTRLRVLLACLAQSGSVGELPEGTSIDALACQPPPANAPGEPLFSRHP